MQSGKADQNDEAQFFSRFLLKVSAVTEHVHVAYASFPSEASLASVPGFTCRLLCRDLCRTESQCELTASVYDCCPRHWPAVQSPTSQLQVLQAVLLLLATQS